LVGVEKVGMSFRKYVGAGVKDSATVISSVGRIVITGAINSTGVVTDRFGFVSEHILSFTRGKTPVSLNAGKSNDFISLDAFFASAQLLEI
jgi:hypothetical protein